jgi:tRNA 2-thiouridine synthesizing protein A
MEELDLRGLKCPLPALMARKRLAALPPGAEIEVWTTDPLAVVDIPHMCHEEGHALNESRAGEGRHVFVIRRKL